jgi:hypothetical protein
LGVSWRAFLFLMKRQAGLYAEHRALPVTRLRVTGTSPPFG